MLTLRSYVWKEWRGHRVTIRAFLFLAIVLGCGLAFLLPRSVVAEGHFTTQFTGGCLLFALVAIGTELIPGEEKSHTLDLLARLPAGLPMAFLAKLIFFLLAMVLFAVVGYLVSTFFRALALPEMWTQPLTVCDQRLFEILFLVMTAALWIFAISCWVPQGLLAIPAVAVLALPYVLCRWTIPGAWLFPWHFYLCPQPFLALIVAWISFVHGKRWGKRGFQAVKHGLLATLVGSAPLWLGLVWWLDDHLTANPAERIEFGQSYLGSTGKMAFLNSCKGNGYPNISLVVNLETGEWKSFGDPCEFFCDPGRLDGHSPFAFGKHNLILQGRSSHSFAYLDGATGKKLAWAPRSWPYPELMQKAREGKKANTPLRMPDGRRVWFLNKHLEVEVPGGSFSELPWDERDTARRVIGYGLSVSSQVGTRSSCSIYDLTRGRLYRDREFEWHCCFVLQDRWLVADSVKNPFGSDPRVRWRLHDPDSGQEQRLTCIQDGEQVLDVLDDGRVLVYTESRGRNQPRQILAVNPRTGTRQQLEFASSPATQVQRPFWLRGPTVWGAPLRSPSGRRLYLGSAQQQGPGGVTSLLPGDTVLTKPVPAKEVLGCLENDWVVVIGPEGKTIEKVSLLTGEREVLFPRPAN